jgi:predicted HAD superfamily phosphohydrolase YqeG
VVERIIYLSNAVTARVTFVQNIDFPKIITAPKPIRLQKKREKPKESQRKQKKDHRKKMLRRI